MRDLLGKQMIFGIENISCLNQIIRLESIYNYRIKRIKTFAIYDVTTLILIFGFAIAEILSVPVADAVKVWRVITVQKLLGLTAIGIAVMNASVSIIQIK